MNGILVLCCRRLRPTLMRGLVHAAVVAGAAGLGNAVFTFPATAQSVDALAAGGLQFLPPESVRIEDVALTLSVSRITVRYRIETSGKRVGQILFPMPAVDLSDPDKNYAFPDPDPRNFLAGKVEVNGKPLPMTVQQRALVAGKDATARLRSLKLPILPIFDFDKALDSINSFDRLNLVAEGLLNTAASAAGSSGLAPGWTVVSTLASGKLDLTGRAEVVLTYSAAPRREDDTVLRSAIRRVPDMATDVKALTADYCVDDAFLKQIDSKAGLADDNAASLVEFRLRFEAGALAGKTLPRFSLTIDSGKALMSFCSRGLKPVAGKPGAFAAENFVVPRAFEVLLIDQVKASN